MRVFFKKAGEVFQVREPTGHRERTPDHFVDWLLHWLNFDFHQAKLNRIGGWSSTGEPKQKRRGFRHTFVKFCPHLSQMRMPSASKHRNCGRKLSLAPLRSESSRLNFFRKVFKNSGADLFTAGFSRLFFGE
jgi:hypothetical protein